MSLNQEQPIVLYDAEKATKKRKRGRPSEKDFTVATVDEVISLKKRTIEATKKWLYKQEDIAEKMKNIPNDVLQLLLAPSSRFKFKHITMTIDNNKYVLYVTKNSMRNNSAFNEVVLKTPEGAQGEFFCESQPPNVQSWKKSYGVLFGKTLGELMMLESEILTDDMTDFCGAALTEAAIFLATLSQSDLEAFSSLHLEVDGRAVCYVCHGGGYRSATPAKMDKSRLKNGDKLESQIDKYGGEDAEMFMEWNAFFRKLVFNECAV